MAELSPLSNPPFLESMSTGERAKTIAYIDSALFILGMVLMGIFSIVFAFQYNPEESDSGQVRLLFIGLIVRFIIGGSFQLVMIVLLLEGVLLKNYNRCYIWLVTNRIFLILMTVSALIKLFLDPISIFAEVVGIIYKFFCLKIVNGYAIELSTDSVFHN